MNYTRVAIAVGTLALAAFPLATLGDASPTAEPALMPIKTPANAATMVCRPHQPGAENPHGTVGSQPVVCKSMQAAMVGGMMKVPQTKGLDGEQTDKMWRIWVEQAMSIPKAGDAGG